MSKYSEEFGKELNGMYDDAVNNGLVKPVKEINLRGKAEIFYVTDEYRKKLEEEMPQNSLLIEENVIYIRLDEKPFGLGIGDQYKPESIVKYLQNDLKLKSSTKEGLEGTLFKLGNYEISLDDIISVLEGSKKYNPPIKYNPSNKKVDISKYFDTIKYEGPMDIESLKREEDDNKTKPRRTIYGIDVISRD